MKLTVIQYYVVALKASLGFKVARTFFVEITVTEVYAKFNGKMSDHSLVKSKVTIA